MKKYEYVEGKQALESFEEGMKSLFKVPTKKAAKAPGKQSTSASVPRKSTKRKHGN